MILGALGQELQQILNQEWSPVSPSYSPATVGLSLVNQGDLAGGLIGELLLDWFYIKLLAVKPELQGQGFGRALVLRAEALARDKKCTGVWVNTYSFQAPEFYTKLGFQEFGRLPNNPRGQDRVFLSKKF